MNPTLKLALQVLGVILCIVLATVFIVWAYVFCC